MTNHIKNMEWANVPYYKKQSIMREIYYDKYDFFYSFTVLYKKQLIGPIEDFFHAVISRNKV